MKLKARIKIALDVFMTLSLMAVMGYQFWGDLAHEWIGAAMFIFFIAHHILNFNWYRTLFKGKYTAYRTVQLITDILVFAAMVGLMVSGIMLSNHVFGFLAIHGGLAFARILHLIASYWGFVLMALHLGLHWNVVIGVVRKAAKLSRPSPVRAKLSSIAGIAIAGYGLYVFINRDLLSYMFLRTQFAFLDYSEPRLLFYLDYFAMMGTFVWIAHTLTKLLQRRSARKRKAQKTEPVTRSERSI